ncbi:MAG: 8-amino-7-oxononanoate synthase [Desulfovibrionaceae bacterium]|nr:8-amino-7-oxononanoate synthase [Desulfovibrionaceae bacterium]
MENNYALVLEEIASKGCLRHIPAIEYREGVQAVLDGQPCLNFSSNDYLALSTNTSLRDAFLQQHGHDAQCLFSSASARLLSGSSQVYGALEAEVAALFGKEACLLFNTGYQCNLGVVSALVGKGDVIFSDKLNHASVVAGMQLSGAAFYRYAHTDYAHLERFLHEHRGKFRRALIISESVFSMDGDVADIDRLIALKKRYDCLLMIDEAHAFGVFGEHLAGCSEGKDVDVITATFGKSLASMGAFCVASRLIIDVLVNKAASFIFSTALPPITVLWTYFLLHEHRAVLYAQREKLLGLCAALGCPTQIIPVLLGESDAAARIARRLCEAHYFVLPIRPPTVPPHTARLRLSLTADMSPAMVRGLLAAVQQLQQEGC